MLYLFKTLPLSLIKYRVKQYYVNCSCVFEINSFYEFPLATWEYIELQLLFEYYIFKDSKIKEFSYNVKETKKSIKKPLNIV